MVKSKLLDRQTFGVVLFLAFILVGNALFLNTNAFRGFNLLDMGGFLDAGWRVYRGQRPYVDFIYYTGPVYLYLQAFFFWLFGFGKTAILTHLVVVHSIAILLVFFMLWRRVPLLWTLLITVLTVPSFYWAVSFPWHDQTAHLWGLVGVLLLARYLPFDRPRPAFGVGLACAFLSVVAFITKSNIGLAWGMMFPVVLASSPQRKPSFLGFAAGLGLGGLFSLALIRFPAEYFDQVLAFSSQGGVDRLRNLLNPARWLVNYYWAAPLALLLPLSFLKKRCPQIVVLFFGVVFVGIFTVATGGMITEGNNMLWGVYLALAFLTLYSLKGRPGNVRDERMLKISKYLLVALALFLTTLSVQYGRQLKVWTYYTPNPEGDYVLETGPLKGWRFYRPEGEPLDLLARFINSRIPKEHDILNLADLYIIYALTGRDSFPGVSFLYLEGVFPAPGRQLDQMRQAIINNPPEWLIIDIRTSYEHDFVALKLGQKFKDAYTPIVRAGFFMLLKRNDLPG